MSLKSILRTANRWFSDTPERALDQAYRAALMITAIEDEHFDGKKISAESADYGDSVISYFEGELKKCLATIKIRLAEFNSSRSVFGSSDSRPIDTSLEINEKQSITIDKLNFIDKVISKYSNSAPSSVSLIPLSQKQDSKVIKSNPEPNPEKATGIQAKYFQNTISPNGTRTAVDPLPNKPGVLPRSILRTVNRIQRELDPNAEEEVVKNFRNSKLKTIISLKFILTLIIVPILTQQVTKTFIVSPIVDQFRSSEEAEIFLNLDMQEEAFEELKRFEEKLHFNSLIYSSPKLTEEEIEEQVQQRAAEIAEEYRERGNNAIKNVFADLLSLIAFCLVIVTNRQDIEILKSFMDDIVYGLSDSAKAFIIILFTDMFVGYHSPHGWEVILESVAQHLGLPENRNFIFLFIATFPVILDSVIKYWIFRYLNRVSPSAVATYRNMNE